MSSPREQTLTIGRLAKLTGVELELVSAHAENMRAAIKRGLRCSCVRLEDCTLGKEASK